MPRRFAFALWINQRLFYGWVMLGIGFLGLLATGPGQSYTIGLFFQPLIEELGVSSTLLSAIYGVGTAVAALGLTYTGRLIDRHGPRRMLAVLSGLLGVVCLLFPLAGSVVGLFFAFTAVRFLGQGSMMLAATNLVSQWFSRYRGLALSITSMGFAVGLAGYPPVVQRLIGTAGWREAWIWLGVWVWLLILPVVLLLAVNRPDDLGLLPDGAKAGAAPDKAAAGAAAKPGNQEPEESWTAQEATRTLTYWFLAVALSIPSALITGMYVYHVSYFAAQGLSAQLAADMLALTSLSMVVSMLGFGQLLDRAPTRLVVGGGILLNGAAMAAMFFTRDTGTAMVYAVLLGASSGSMMTNANYVWPRYYGRKHLGAVQGPAYTVTIIGASLGALPFGIAYDLLGSYRMAVGLMALLPLLFGTGVLFLRPPVKPAPAAPEPA